MSDPDEQFDDPDSATENPDVLVAGETLIDFLPDAPGPLASVETFSRRAGGAPANVAVALARLDETPWFWTRVGEDSFGDYLADELASFGVPDRFVERDTDAKTALAFVSHDADADREFTFYREDTADVRLDPATIPDEVLDGVPWVALGGVMLATEPGRTATLDLAERAADQDCTVVFDPNARPELWDAEVEFADLAARMLDHVDVVTATPEDLAAAGIGVEPADESARASTPGEPTAVSASRESTAVDSLDALAEAVTDLGPHTVLLTLGESGAFATATEDAPWDAQTASHRGYDVDAVDATGAGDAFTAGALAALADGETSLSTVLAFANAVAALTTTAQGAMTALPTREEVRRFRR
ncbi:carbohydrate kinase family protein [Halorussus litoreus]|uniref:carbohydrate kinase family protein n=1 Tax=Halorussus litoreus TaxID=1710536 RepID=UPI000E26CF1F|nr:carbohydrate kinase [Halorussus litoreus]